MDNQNENSRTFRKVVLSIGTLFTLFSLLVFIPKIINILVEDTPKQSHSDSWEGRVMTIMFVTSIIGYAVGWWRILWGGFIILISAFIVSIPFIFLRGNYGSLIFGIPLLVIGILYILLYWVDKRENI